MFFTGEAEIVFLKMHHLFWMICDMVMADQRYAAPLPPLHNESNMPTSCPSTPPTAVCRTIPCRNLAIAYPTKLLPCSITLPIDVLASPSM